MAPSSSKKARPSASSTGAPAQLNQKSRKGKKSWRKNVDIQDVEKGLEQMRQEERVVGKALQKQKDEDLFVIDTKGDDEIRKTVPKFSSLNLTSTKIISQRSAVPAVVSRVTSSASSSSKKRKSPSSSSSSKPLTREDKERLLSIAKKPRKGPFNAIMDQSEYQPGENAMRLGLSEAVKQSGGYDPWGGINTSAKVTILTPSGGLSKTIVEDEDEVPMLIENDAEEEDDGFQPPKPLAPNPPKHSRTLTSRSLIALPAVSHPHAGASYNPPEAAHRELLLIAAEAEEKKVKELEKMAETKKRIELLKEQGTFGDEWEEEGGSGRPGMKVQSLSDDEDEEGVNGEEGKDGEEEKVKASIRKTKAQKNKAAKVLEQKRVLAKKASIKQLLSSIDQAKSFRKSLSATERKRVEAHQAKQAQKLEEIKTKGMAGQKLGKHRVPESEMEVQVGEDLSESLRGLKPEGNLFRDRFQSLQQRALIEPRALVLPKKRRNRIIEYEKHAWKNFK